MTSITELTPLYQFEGQSHVAHAIAAIGEKEPLADPHVVKRRVLKVAASVVSIAGKLAFVPVSLQLGRLLGPLAAAGEGLSYFVLEYWASTAIIDDFYRARTQALFDLRAHSEPPITACRKVSVISVATLFALASQLPVAMPGVTYTPQPFKPAVGVVLLLSGSLTPLRSLQLSLTHLTQTCQRTRDTQLPLIKTKLAHFLRSQHSAFVELPYEQKLQRVADVEAIRVLDLSREEKIQRYLMTFLQPFESSTTPIQAVTHKVTDTTGFAVGALLAGAFEYVSGDYLFHSTKTELLDNDGLAVVLATLSVASTAYLIATSIVTTTQRIFNTLGSACSGKEFRNLSWQLRPKMSGALTVMGLFCNLFAVASTFVILGDFYKDKEVERDVFIATTCSSLFLLLFTSTLDVIDDVVSFSIAKGTEEERKILALSQEFIQLAELVEQCPAHQLLGYVNQMDEESRLSILDTIEIDPQEIVLSV